MNNNIKVSIFLFLIIVFLTLGLFHINGEISELKNLVSNKLVEYNEYFYSETFNNSYYELVNTTTTYNIVEQYHFNRKEENYCSGKSIGSMTKLFIYGNSMNPTIFHDDDVYVAEFSHNDNVIELVQEGDILAVYTDDTKEEIIVHRLVGIYPERFIMKGDNNPRFDGEWLDYDLIMGVVCAWQRT